MLWAGVALAGDPDSSGDPASTLSFGLEVLYNRFITRVVGKLAYDHTE